MDRQHDFELSTYGGQRDIHISILGCCHISFLPCTQFGMKFGGVRPPSQSAGFPILPNFGSRLNFLLTEWFKRFLILSHITFRFFRDNPNVHCFSSPRLHHILNFWLQTSALNYPPNKKYGLLTVPSPSHATRDVST